MKAKKLWVHAGGGCWLVGNMYPCDDEYRHEKTGRKLTCQTTPDQHFAMPSRVSGAAELRQLPGVSRVRESKGSQR